MNRACLPSLCSWAAALVFASASAWAQIDIVSSPNPVGSGARALGMGSAFVAVADDATAASWNPGGLTQLERPEASLVLSSKWFSEDFGSETHPELSSNETVNFSDINYLSFVYPFKHTIAGRNLVFSLNYQRKFDFDRKLNYDLHNWTAGGGGTIGDTFTKNTYTQSGQLSTLSPAFGFEILDNLSVGVVWNIWNQSILPDNRWEAELETHARFRVNNKIFGGSYNKLVSKEEFENFEANNFTFGTLYKPNQRWSIGATYNTEFTASLDYVATQRQFTQGIGFGFSKRTRPKQYTFPSSAAIGVAYRFPNDKVTVSFDVTRVDWGAFEIYDPRNVKGRLRHVNGITGQPMDIAPSIDPTYTVRLGMEYVFVNPSKPRQDYLPSVRAGVFYDPEPSGGRSLGFWGTNKGDGSPSPFYGFSLGTGVLIKNRVNIDFAYTFRTGDGVRKDTFGGVQGTDADVTQHLFYLSTVIYF